METENKTGKYLGKVSDEYSWPSYPMEYQSQIKSMILSNENDFFITDFDEDKGRNIVFKNKLHQNWKEIYSFAYKVNPKSIAEIGCGSMQHLLNLSTILPSTKLYGFDLLQEQVDFGRDYFKVPEHIYKNVSILDFTKEQNLGRRFEMCYTQAVLMHLSTQNAIAMLRNIERIAEKYILLVEGVVNHWNWNQLVKEVMPEFDFKLTTKYIDYGILLTRK